MSDTPKDANASKTSPAKDARQARLDAALRANLKRRKAADAARPDLSAPDTPPEENA
jgi:hypothetical protein